MALKKNPVWRGSKELIEIGTSPAWDISGDGTTVTRTFQARYQVCLDKRPGRGQTMSGFGNLIVDRVRIQKNPGDKGEMTVTMISPEGPEGSFDQFEPQHEIEWVQLEKDLRQHPRYVDGSNALSDEDLNNLDAWENEKDWILRREFKFRSRKTEDTDVGEEDPVDEQKTEIVELSDNAKDLARKLLRGQETYWVYAPVLRRTRESSQTPATSTSGKIVSPSGFPSVPQNYEWLQTADRGTRSGRQRRWERTEELTGADKWDPDIYS